jgi:phosphatidyl-myo-inositol dimannoside synthase
VRRHLLVTNDFPPKVGGIQNYLWELWRRLDPDCITVYCTPHAGAVAFDARQQFRIERSPEPVLLPYPWLVDRIDRLADEVDADLVILDPALPLGHIGPALDRPFGVVLHGAEVTIAARVPGSKQLLRNVLANAALVISAGAYALAEAETCVGDALPAVVIPPGVDIERFAPATTAERHRLRLAYGLEPSHQLVACVTRLVPRKGMHTLIRALGLLAPTHPNVRGVIGGSGRQEGALQRLATGLGAPVDFVGPLTDPEVVGIYQAADVMAMPCNQRWGGLEQEGFGIVFLEAAATGVPQVAGRSGGAAEAVVDGVTGVVVDHPDDPQAVADAISLLLSDDELRASMAVAGRRRACDEFHYDQLAQRLAVALELVGQCR